MDGERSRLKAVFDKKVRDLYAHINERSGEEDKAVVYGKLADGGHDCSLASNITHTSGKASARLAFDLPRYLNPVAHDESIVSPIIATLPEKEIKDLWKYELCKTLSNAKTAAHISFRGGKVSR